MSSEALWLGRIRDALDEDRFVLYAQPIVDLMTGQTVQHELLLRMRSEDGQIIAPGAFLPAAERYGLISEIDRWVIRQAVQIAAEGVPTEFNLSGRSIGDPDILRELATAIEESGVDPSLLVVEVTETAFVGQTEAGRAFAQRVRELGCRLALDDFGTGFSSLSYLKHLPADHLKIDIDFVRELTSSETDARVVRGIVGLAREFNQTTIAEGVEDEETLDPAPRDGRGPGPGLPLRASGPDGVRRPRRRSRSRPSARAWPPRRTTTRSRSSPPPLTRSPAAMCRRCSSAAIPTSCCDPSRPPSGPSAPPPTAATRACTPICATWRRSGTS